MYRVLRSQTEADVGLDQATTLINAQSKLKSYSSAPQLVHDVGTMQLVRDKTVMNVSRDDATMSPRVHRHTVKKDTMREIPQRRSPLK